ncbi:MAG: hypothetical protein M1825_003439 [Sarcosagium campestre]|nr:MAG: hypothetical protein M1825_003439 [Sarcosagium campestre]
MRNIQNAFPHDSAQNVKTVPSPRIISPLGIKSAADPILIASAAYAALADHVPPTPSLTIADLGVISVDAVSLPIDNSLFLVVAGVFSTVIA